MSAREYLELILLLATVTAFSLWALRKGSHWGRFPTFLRRWPARRHGPLIAAALFGFLVSALMSWARPHIVQVHDEFSYLLAAETYASGRLTNPAHPLWVHFETFHVLHQPTYQSKYPPAQGLVLALGVLLGSPIIGVWISAGLACAALFWMFRDWMPPHWAAIAAALPFVREGVFRGFGPDSFYWSRSFWGAWIAVAGAALLFGGLFRVYRRPNWRDSALLALGLVVLANSRPFDGLLASLPAAVVIFAMPFRKDGPGWAAWARGIVAPVTLVLALSAIAMGYYNYRVTGDSLLLPYVAHEKQHQVTPHIIYMKSNQKVEHRHDELRGFYDRAQTRRAEAFKENPSYRLRDFARLGRFFLGPALWLPLLALPFVLGGGRARAALAATLLVLAGYTTTLAGFGSPLPHYVSPAVPALFFLVVLAMRRIAVVKIKRRPVGRAVALAILSTVAVSFFVSLAANRELVQNDLATFGARRLSMQQQLASMPGEHLVVLHYGDKHSVHNEWVYNHADIDRSKVVWARDMGVERNRELIDYYPGREKWLLFGDEIPPRLIPYSEEAAAAVEKKREP